MKVCSNPAQSKSTSAIYSSSICSLHAPALHFGNSHISNIFIIIISTMVIWDEGTLILLLGLAEGSDDG